VTPSLPKKWPTTMVPELSLEHSFSDKISALKELFEVNQ
jgi:hypothetical protein